MHDVKNIFLAWVSSITSVFAAIEARDLMTIFSAIVLPILFFTIGKTVDVCLQIYFRRPNERRDQISQNGGKE